jgi:hypothetical protein
MRSTSKIIIAITSAVGLCACSPSASHRQIRAGSSLSATTRSPHLARGLRADDTLDAELVELVYEQILPVAEHLHETGMFAPPVPVASDAALQTRLLALFGRRA